MFSVIKGRQRCWLIIIQTVLFNDGFNVQVKLLTIEYFDNNTIQSNFEK